MSNALVSLSFSLLVHRRPNVNRLRWPQCITMRDSWVILLDESNNRGAHILILSAQPHNERDSQSVIGATEERHEYVVPSLVSNGRKAAVNACMGGLGHAPSMAGGCVFRGGEARNSGEVDIKRDVDLGPSKDASDDMGANGTSVVAMDGRVVGVHVG